MNQFYITLPSNTIGDGNNTPSQFIVRLPQKVNLVGDWECGLCQLIYPHNWEILTNEEREIKIQDANKKEHVIKLPDSCYDTVKDVIEAIQFYIQNNINENISKGVFLTYHSSIKRVYIKIVKDYVKKITFSAGLAKKLGYDSTIISMSSLGTHEIDLTSGKVDVMYIYMNILEHQIVGDVSAPLLRIINVEGKYPDIIDRTFDYPHYLPILVKDISQIEVSIKDDLDKYIKFSSGKVIIKLHFRKVKQSLL